MKQKENFHKQEFLDLLNSEKKLRKQNKSLEDVDRFKNSRLVEYWDILTDHIFFKSRQDYYNLFNSFYYKKITFDEFAEQFVILMNSNLLEYDVYTKNLLLEIDDNETV